MSKFIIFASARTGSTSLSELLSKSKNVKLCFEPFNESYPKWKKGNKDYLSIIKDEKSLHKELDEIFENFNAIKVLDYQLSERLNLALLSRKDINIIFLRRKNLFNMALSDLVAHQVGEWRKTSRKNLYKNLKEIDEKKMENKMKYIKHLNDVFYNFLRDIRNGDYLSLWYEELYSENADKNLTTLKKICDFLNIPLPSKNEVQKYMKPSSAKINVDNIYKSIPNYEHLANKFKKYTIIKSS